MLIFAVDDELDALETNRSVLAEAAPEAEIRTFTRAVPALEAISRDGLRPEIVFCDVEMPGLSGLEFAVRLKTLSPDTRIVFVTGFLEYAVGAFKLKVQGYLLKPLQVEDVREELQYLPPHSEPQADRLRARCFGNFEVFWHDRPLKFSRQKTKELLAYLIDREGAYCTAGEVIGILWEDRPANADTKHYLRVLLSDLNASLREIGMEGLLLRKRGQMAVDCSLVDCDLYEMMRGDMNAVNSFRGQYMSQYSWAELTTGRLYFHGN